MEISQVPGLSATLNRRKTPGGGGPAPWLRHSLALNGRRFIPFLSPILDVSSGYTSHTSIQSRSSNVATAGDHGAPVLRAPWPPLRTGPGPPRALELCESICNASQHLAPQSQVPQPASKPYEKPQKASDFAETLPKAQPQTPKSLASRRSPSLTRLLPPVPPSAGNDAAWPPFRPTKELKTGLWNHGIDVKSQAVLRPTAFFEQLKLISNGTRKSG